MHAMSLDDHMGIGTHTRTIKVIYPVAYQGMRSHGRLLSRVSVAERLQRRGMSGFFR